MDINNFELTPSVDPTQEFVEIAYDFANPLDLVREGISNSFDAEATEIEILFEVETEYGEKVLIITINDNGHGMSKPELQSFFDLGNSTRRDDDSAIGEKGHGTKVYFNSSEINVTTTHNGTRYVAVMETPIKKLHDHIIPLVSVTAETCDDPNGTSIVIKGYNNNRRDKFTHEILKDYILWFTKMGSVEKEFGIEKYKDIQLILKGVNRKEPETIIFGHIFPEESKNVTLLFDEYLA